MRFNSLAFRLIATSAAWTLIVLPVAAFLIYRLYRNDVQEAFDGGLEKLVNAIALDAMDGSGRDPVTPGNTYEPYFDTTHSGWYWQVKPLDDPNAKRLVSASLATNDLFEGRGVTRFLIHAGYHTARFLCFGLSFGLLG